MFVRLLCLSLLGFVLLPTAARAVAAGDPEKFDGKIFAVTDQSVTVGTDDDQHAFKIAKDTKITLDGSPAHWEDLRAGFVVTVFGMRTDDNMWVAREIAAFANE